MDATLTTATWLWLLIPMPLLVLLSLVSWLRHLARANGEG